MKSLKVFGAIVMLFHLGAPVFAGPRDDAWKNIAIACDNNLPKTTLKLLKPIETAAFADKAWGEATKALLMRVRLQNGLWFSDDLFPPIKKPPIDPNADPFAPVKADPFDPANTLPFDPVEDDRNPFNDPFKPVVDDPFAEQTDTDRLANCVQQLETEIATAPANVRPVLRWFQARWLLEYYDNSNNKYRNRSELVKPVSDDITTWDSKRFVIEIEKYFQLALADKEALRKIPVADFREIMTHPGALGDSLRPTLYDLIVHSQLAFLNREDVREEWPGDVLKISTDSPALGTSDAFLAWQLVAEPQPRPEFLTLRLYQELLAFHRDDADRSAFLHCNLERIRFAGNVAVGADQHRRHTDAIRNFIAENATHPLSADARQDDVVLWLQVKKTKEAHASALAGAEAFPDHPFGKVCRGIVNEMEIEWVEIDTPKTWAPSGDEIMIKQKNLSKVWFRIYRYDWQPNAKTLRGETVPNSDEAIQPLLNTKPFREWSTEMPHEKDYREHSMLINSPKDLETGYFLLVVSGREKFGGKDSVLSWTGIHVSQFNVVLNGAMSESEKVGGFVVDTITGAPVANIPVGIWVEYKENTKLVKLECQTNEEGVFLSERLDFSQERYASFVVAAEKGGHRAVCRGYLSSQSIQEEEEKGKVTFFTDRSIYRPGQTIHFKGIYCETDEEKGSYQTIKGKKLTVTFAGSNDQQIASLDVISNEYGSFTGSFIAPANSLLGSFTISVGEIGAQSIRVEEYKRPTFTVEILAPTTPLVLGGNVEVKGIAKAYTGAPVDGAKVEWTVDRSPYWTGWGAWNQWNEINLESKQVATGKAITGADGTFTITFTADPDDIFDPAMEPIFNYYISADVTDQAGASNFDGRNVNVGYTEFNAELTTNEWLEQGKPAVIDIITRTHDGGARPADGTLRIYKLIEPEVCPRDFEYIDDPNPLIDAQLPGPEGWALGELVHESAVKTEIQKDTGDSVAKVSVDLPAGMYRAVYESSDNRGRKVAALMGLHVVNPQADRFVSKLPFFTGSPVLTCEPGETFTLLWGSGFDTARACVEWYRDNTLIKREWSTPGRTQQVFSFTPDESLRGGFTVRVLQFSFNRMHSDEHSIIVPWSNKKLTLRWEHITSKLEPGAKDTWTAVVSGPDGAAAVAEMVATLYDASLDDLYWHQFSDFSSLFRDSQSNLGRCQFSASFTYASDSNRDSPDYWGVIRQPFRTLLRGLDEGNEYTAIGINYEGRVAEMDHGSRMVLLESEVWESYNPPELPNSVGYDNRFGMGIFPVTPATPVSPRGLLEFPSANDAKLEAERRALTDIVTRKKLQETAFFYPQLTSGPDGTVRMSFTMPEGLGKWSFKAFAHDTAMRFGSLQGETITAKDLMVQPNPPRFLREDDVLDFTVRITNQNDQEQSGLARLALTDAATDVDANAALGVNVPEQSFVIPAKQSRTLSWRLTVPDGAGFLRYKALATCGNLSDGEEGWLPVLPRRVLVTDSMSMPIRDASTKNFTFEKLRDSGKSDTLKHQMIHVQAVSQPAWHAVMALPYLMEFPHECAEQTFSRYYANALARHLVRSDPKIRRVFDQWRNTDALESPLTKNQDLKGILLEETPWLQDAAQESLSRKRVGLLFEDNHLDAKLAETLTKLNGMQQDDGLWPWFSGGQGSEYISLYIAAGFGRLRAIGVETDITPALKALPGIDALLTERYRDLRKSAWLDNNNLDPWVAHHLYTRSFFLKDKQIAEEYKAAYDYFLKQAKEFWPKLGSNMATAHVALALSRFGEATTAKLITRSLQEMAVNHPTAGMSWTREKNDSWWWWQAPIETQATIIAAFLEIDGNTKAVEDCKVWLIQQKQLRDWGTTKATADAVQALLSGKSSLSSDALLQVSLGGTLVEPEKVEAGTGFYEKRFVAAEVKPEMAEIALTKTDPGVAWASVHWQYLEDIAKLTSHNNANLKLEKSLFIKRSTPQGPKLDAVNGAVNVGDELVTRLILRNDRAMEYIHLKDARGSGTEPVNVLSGHRYQDNLSYYEVTRDTASHFFIEQLPPGTHVFETSVRVQHAGIYQTGIAEIRCMYAPEFQARSGSIKIEVKKQDAAGER